MDIFINAIECQEDELEMDEETIGPMEQQAKVENIFHLNIRPFQF